MSSERAESAVRHDVGMTDFKQAVHHDPYTALITRLMADAWAMGYEAARREVEHEATDERGLIDRNHPYAPLCAALRRLSGSELRNRAVRELDSASQKAEADAILALATVGREFPDLLNRRHRAP